MGLQSTSTWLFPTTGSGARAKGRFNIAIACRSRLSRFSNATASSGVASGIISTPCISSTARNCSGSAATDLTGSLWPGKPPGPLGTAHRDCERGPTCRETAPRHHHPILGWKLADELATRHVAGGMFGKAFPGNAMGDQTRAGTGGHHEPCAPLRTPPPPPLSPSGVWADRGTESAALSHNIKLHDIVANFIGPRRFNKGRPQLPPVKAPGREITFG